MSSSERKHAPRPPMRPIRRRSGCILWTFGENQGNGVSWAPPPSQVPFRTWRISRLTLPALEAYTAAMDASISVGYADKFVDGAVEDFETLFGLGLGRYPQAGHPIDPAPAGPLGSLWPDEHPALN